MPAKVKSIGEAAFEGCNALFYADAPRTESSGDGLAAVFRLCSDNRAKIAWDDPAVLLQFCAPVCGALAPAAAAALLHPDFTPPQQQPRALELKPLAQALQAKLFQKDGSLDPQVAVSIEDDFIPAARQLFAACVEQARSMVPEMRMQYHSVRKNHRSIYFDTLTQIRLEPVFPTLQTRSDKLVKDLEALGRPKAQTARTVTELLRGARAVTDRYNALLRSVGKKNGVHEDEQHVIGNKGLFRICEKLALAPTWQPQCVQDAVRGAIECKDFTTMVNVLRLLCDLDDALKTTGETGGLQERIVITRSKGRFGRPTSGGWADIMVNFHFADDPNQHICELQLVHTQLFTVRKNMGAHKSYAVFRAALELCEMVGANPEEGADPAELEELAWKGPAAAQQGGDMAGLEKRVEELEKLAKEGDATIVEQGANIAEQTSKNVEQDATIVEQGAKIVEQGAKIVEQVAKIVEQGAKIVEQGAKIVEQDATIAEQGASITSLKEENRALRNGMAELERQVKLIEAALFEQPKNPPKRGFFSKK